MPRACPHTLVALLALAAAPRAARAQWRADLEVSGARLRQETERGTAAATVGGFASRDGARTALAVAALGTVGADARHTAQALASAALLGTHGPHARWSVGADGGAFAEGGADASLSGYLVARERLAWGAQGAWIGGALGGVRDHGEGYAVRMGDAGLWRALGRLRAAATATVTDTRAGMDVPSNAGTIWVTFPTTFTDAAAELSWMPREPARAGALALRAAAGARLIARGAFDGPRRRDFGSASAELTVGPRVVVVGSFGRQLSDLARGTPATRYAALGLRVAVRADARRPGRAALPSAAPRVLVERAGDGASRLVVVAPAAHAVEVTGSFTGWEAVTLVREGDRFVLPGRLPAGAHRLLLRLDGGEWFAPANLAAASDEDGARTALLVVP